MKCTRPEWSHEFNDYCPCDNEDDFKDAWQEACNPCEECSWYKEVEE